MTTPRAAGFGRNPLIPTSLATKARFLTDPGRVADEVNSVSDMLFPSAATVDMTAGRGDVDQPPQ
jgi:hypothetical protein